MREGSNLRCGAGVLNWGAGWKAAEMKTDERICFRFGACEGRIGEGCNMEP